MGKFKVGDKVIRTNGSYCGMREGEIGVVTKVDPDFRHVHLLEYTGNGHSIHSLELAEMKIANTKTARKIYKNRIVEETEEYLIISL